MFITMYFILDQKYSFKLNVYMYIYIQEYCKKKLSNRGRIKIFQK